jgi:uncharacterized protein with FMN-binding domain
MPDPALPPHPPDRPAGPTDPGLPAYLSEHPSSGGARSPQRRPASLARRAAPALVLVGVGAGLLALLDHPSPPADDDESLSVDDASGATSAGSSPTTTAGRPTSPTTNRPSTTTAPSSTVPATPTSCDGATVTGSSVSTRFGPVQVQATFTAAGKLCDVEALDWPQDDSKSRSINQRALPTLESRAVSADGTSFNAVSGATITTNAYKRSLQSALDQR